MSVVLDRWDRALLGAGFEVGQGTGQVSDPMPPTWPAGPVLMSEALAALPDASGISVIRRKREKDGIQDGSGRIAYPA